MPTKAPASVLAAIALLLGAGAPAAYGATSQATKDRCTQYAQRAVAQYQLMTSHPQCKVNDDPRWQSNIDNHYNACIAVPEFIIKSEEAARDSHLQACGGLTAATAENPAVVGNSAVGSSGTAKASTSTTMPSAAPAAAVASPKANCQLNAPSALPATATPVGVGASVKGGTLSFQSYQQKGRVLTYKVVRPAYIVAQMHCTGRVEDLYGPWISLTGSQGPEIFYVNLGNSVSGAPLSVASATQLTQP
jgi:hypothetical protein